MSQQALLQIHSITFFQVGTRGQEVPGQVRGVNGANDRCFYAMEM